ncbi:hypothetical protein QYE76_038452 [Lolium multiflorum]|uniref:RNase H type-1 domain-containing protein n=1 Tax=Lolium multiflorum TaxID=4521 RepID=A0AAD8T7W8_LOLMU|nr:hypothetical protein QYE76_038452 [Lolium multiflorum]
MKAKILVEVKKEIQKMLDAGFISHAARQAILHLLVVADTSIASVVVVQVYDACEAVKGQALADLIAERINTDVAALSVRAWAMFFDGSVCEDGCGIGVLLVSPRGATYSFSIGLSTPCTNNVAEYEAICKGMELLLDAGEAVEIFGDSKLVISQLTKEYKCESELLFPLDTMP